MNNCLIILFTHVSVTSDTIWVIIVTNEYTSLANAHYCVSLTQSHTHE